tara:strand:+ start:7209 stop:8678 length:1470 start_codon:yes stop_codon:yes gene_type:complete
MLNKKLKIYNTLSKKKELFKSINKNKVGMYVCGPTVYGEPHLGHARPAITFDIVYRYLMHLNNKVRYVRNITDVGHLLNDSDDGEDKMQKQAKKENIEPMEIAHKYTNEYHNAMNKLNCLSPNIEPRATGHIIEQINMIEKILKNGFAYEKNGSVYLDVKKYNSKYKYGILSRRKLENNLEGTRKLKKQNEKKNSYDFSLWKKATKDHIMKWPSPWSIGYPGWHLECSAMSNKYLGETFDIHGGGTDLLFPHHEAEITQSNACFDKNSVKYWMHNNMITIEGQKMGKSLNNFITLNEFFKGEHKFLKRSFSPMTIRFFILQAHYRSTLDFSNSALSASEKGLTKLFNAIDMIDKIKPNKKSSFNVKKISENFYKSINDDFNTPVLFANIFEAVKLINLCISERETLNKKDKNELKNLMNLFIKDILGLQNSNINKSDDFDKIMSIITKIRNKSRQNKNWDISDLIRDELKKLKINIKDTKDGSEWEYEK